MRTLALLLALLSAVASAQVTEPPKRYALVVGIDDYLEDDLDLRYAVADATAMRDVLAEHDYDVTLMVNDVADRRRLIRELSSFAQRLRPEDTFVLYLAGHGMRNTVTKEVYWLPYDIVVRQPDVEGVRIAHLIDYLDDIPAHRKIVILDHCFSGELGKVLANAGARSGSYGPPTTPRDAFPAADYRDSVARTSSGIFIATAARGLAQEDPQDGHGLMTWALLQAVQTNGADLDDGGASDGALSIMELKHFLYRTVKRASESRGFEQVPIADVFGTDRSITEQEWKPFLRSLTPAERLVFADRYRAKLMDWRTDDIIDESVRKYVEDALVEWTSNAATYTALHRKIVYALRDTVDGTPLLDSAKAHEVARRVNAIVAGEGS